MLYISIAEQARWTCLKSLAIFLHWGCNLDQQKRQENNLNFSSAGVGSFYNNKVNTMTGVVLPLASPGLQQPSFTVYPKKYAHGFVVLCFVVVMQSFIMNSHEVSIHIHQGCFAGTGAIVRLPQCQWSKPGGYGKISQCITTTKHNKAKTVCIFLGIYCSYTGQTSPRPPKEGCLPFAPYKCRR